MLSGTDLTAIGDLGQEVPHAVRLHRDPGVVQQPVELVELTVVFSFGHREAPLFRRCEDPAFASWHSEGRIVTRHG